MRPPRSAPADRQLEEDSTHKAAHMNRQSGKGKPRTARRARHRSTDQHQPGKAGGGAFFVHIKANAYMLHACSSAAKHLNRQMHMIGPVRTIGMDVPGGLRSNMRGLRCKVHVMCSVHGRCKAGCAGQRRPQGTIQGPSVSLLDLWPYLWFFPSFPGWSQHCPLSQLAWSALSA